jgi:3',5'-cyclic AMP phosphodiesterase CpdA
MTSTTSSKFARTTWLKKHGIERDPFQPKSFHADGDRFLSNPVTFVDPPYYEGIRGTPDNPGFNFIFGYKGSGKSSLRRNIKRELDDHLRKPMPIGPKVLAVEYIGHGYGSAGTDFVFHSKRIATRILQEAAKLGSRVDCRTENLEGINLLQEVIACCCALEEVDYIYLLVDNVDSQGDESTRKCYHKIKSLVCNTMILSLEKLTVKYFLPIEFSKLSDHGMPIGFGGNPHHVMLGWNEQQLTQLLHQRLEASVGRTEANTGLPILARLCDDQDSDTIENELIQFGLSHDQPRAMLWLGYHLLDKHFKHLDGSERRRRVDELIQLETLKTAKRHMNTHEHVSVQTLKEPVLLRYLHISDLHLRYEYAESKAISSDGLFQDVITRSLLKAIKKEINKSAQPFDFVVITGDLAYSGKAEEYQVVENFCEKLLEITKLSKDDLFIVPGNHDVDRRFVNVDHHMKWLYSFEDQKEIADILTYGIALDELMKKFENFNAFANRAMGRSLFATDKYFYTDSLLVQRQGTDFQIHFLGLNSAIFAGYDGDDEQRLALGTQQVENALRQLDENGNLVIALFHHPFECFHESELVNQNRLKHGADLLLHGHLHRPLNAVTRDAAGDVVIIGAGASYETRESENSFNIVEIDLLSGKGEVCFFKYLKDHGAWVENCDVNPYNSEGKFRFTIEEIKNQEESHG